MPLTVELDIQDEQARQYFLSCARIRNVMPRSMFRRLFDVIAKDQLVGPILDDADELRARRKGEHRYSERKRGE